MSAVTVAGDIIHYEVLGRGRQVVLVHGWLGSWRYWIPAMQQLQSKYRVYALDLYGFGDSGKNPAKYTLEHQVALLADFMQDLGIPKAALIGHGLGALVVTEFARQYPDRVARMMLLSAPLFDPGDLDRRVPVMKKVMQQPVARPQPEELLSDPNNNPAAATIMSPSAAMRAALLEAARARANGVVPPAAPADVTVDRANVLSIHTRNPLLSLVSDPETLLNKAFRKNEPAYDKLSVDVTKTDPRAVRGAIVTFDAGRMLDTLRLLPMPIVLIHGLDDPIISAPPEAVWNYVTMDKEHLLLPIEVPGVRHFPMLEYDPFPRLVNDFLEVPDISKIEIKERWKRRTR
jgi:pimeloyl-ACP methyl ester carboxylesterase